MDLLLRDVVEADIAAIAAIYAEQVDAATNSYEYQAPERDEMLRRMRAIVEAGHPYLVAERAGRLLGYAYASSYRAREGYRWTVENSVYVDAAARGQGIGGALLSALIAACEHRGYRQMIAVVGDATNTASIRLHERFGFRVVGTFSGIGRKHGRWLDALQMQRALGPGDAHPPTE